MRELSGIAYGSTPYVSGQPHDRHSVACPDVKLGDTELVAGIIVILRASQRFTAVISVCVCKKPSFILQVPWCTGTSQSTTRRSRSGHLSHKLVAT